MRYSGFNLALLVVLVMCCAATEAVAQSSGLLAQGQPPVPKPYAIWVAEALGLLRPLDGAVGSGSLRRRVPRRVSGVLSGGYRRLLTLSLAAIAVGALGCLRGRRLFVFSPRNVRDTDQAMANFWWPGRNLGIAFDRPDGNPSFLPRDRHRPVRSHARRGTRAQQPTAAWQSRRLTRRYL